MIVTITYSLAPIPKWIIIANDGLTAGGAKLYTRSSLNPLSNKAVYQDPAGAIPWTNPIIFDLNGTQGPFYWKTDTSNPNDLYYLEAYDSDDTLLWTLDNYAPPGGSGGGGGTTFAPLKNMIANNVFINNSGTIGPTNITNSVIAPSNHVGFTPADLNPIIVSNSGAVGPDIRFVKNNTGLNSDTISFVNFNGANAFGTTDVVPDQYVRYQCTGSPAGESYKAFQYPICWKVQNLEDTAVTFTCLAKVAVDPVTVNIKVKQYFGSYAGVGANPTTTLYNTMGSMALTTTWTKFNVQFTIPNTAGSTLSDCGDDALYLHMEMPLGQNCDVWFTKPSLYIGTLSSFADFETYDQIYGVIQTPRTGDTKASFLPSVPPGGWLYMNDGTIGSASSGATQRQNIDTFQLFKTLWDGVSNTNCPVLPGGRGASAVFDFTSNKTLRFPITRGRVIAETDVPGGHNLGDTLGTDTVTHTLTSAELPDPLTTGANAFLAAGGGTAVIASSGAPGGGSTITNNGGNNSFTLSIMQPTTYYNLFIKL